MRFTPRTTRYAAAFTLLAMSLFLLPAASRSQKLGGILKGGAIVIAVQQFGGEINKFVNRLTGTRTTAVEYTKVVPIISAGQGVAVGAVQVTGSRTAVNKVRAVAQLEGSFERARVRALIPVSTMNPTKNPSRVRGVGVSALIDLRL